MSTSPEQFRYARMCLNLVATCNLRVYGNGDNSLIFIDDADGKTLCNGFNSVEEMYGWLVCWREFSAQCKLSTM